MLESGDSGEGVRDGAHEVVLGEVEEDEVAARSEGDGGEGGVDEVGGEVEGGQGGDSTEDGGEGAGERKVGEAHGGDGAGEGVAGDAAPPAWGGGGRVPGGEGIFRVGKVPSCFEEKETVLG